MINSGITVSEYLAQTEKELRVPITTIIGNVEQIAREHADAALHDDVIGIKRAADTLISLTDDLIDIVKIGNNELEIADDDYDFEDIILEIRRMIEKQASLKGIGHEIDIDNNIPCRFFGDKIRVGKMLRRLVRNAIDVTESGTVRFSASCMPGSLGSMFLRFDVSDSGSGELDEDVAATLAGKTSRSDISSAATSVFIIKYIAGRMGGKFTARAKKGEGCIFTLLIAQKPVGLATFKDRILESETGDAGEQHLFVGKKVRALIAGESKDVAMLGQQSIYKYRIGSDITDDPDETLMLLTRIRYDAVIVSENMKTGDGRSLVDAIRELAEACPDRAEYFEKLPIVTAESVNGEEAVPALKRIDGRLSVPYDNESIEDVLKKLVPKDKIKYSTLHSYDTRGIESLKELGLDCIEAFERFGSDEEGYRKAVLSVCRSSDTKGKMLNYYLDQSDYKNYIVIIRSMYDAARLIGSEELSKEAKELEKAAKYNPGPEMAERTAEFAENFENILASVRSVMTDSTDETNKGAIDREDLIYLINELRGYLSDYQIREVEELFFTLAQFSYEDPKIMELIHEAEEHMLEYSYNEVMVTLDTIITKLQG